MSQVQRPPLILAMTGLAILCVLAFFARGGFAGEGIRYGAGAILGAIFGFALYHASFGFAGPWRKFIRERQGAGIRAHIILIGACAITCWLLIGYQDAIGIKLYPVIIGMGLSSALGAAMFGIGMQMGGGCASGTLFSLAGGSTRTPIVLAFFILGSVLATAHMSEFWQQLDEITGIPNLPAISVIKLYGPVNALIGLFFLLAIIWFFIRRMELTTNGQITKGTQTGSLVYGPWALVLGAAAIAGVMLGSFLLFGRPLGITSAFALWGAKIFQLLGIDVTTWGYWQGWRANQLSGSIFADRISVSNFGIIFGAISAAALAGKLNFHWQMTTKDFLIAAIGGLLMGYGARLAYGCNIGAFVSGLASGSLHGVWWLVWGFIGSYVGIQIRVFLAMDPPQNHQLQRT